jgi:hypothetical protein
MDLTGANCYRPLSVPSDTTTRSTRAPPCPTAPQADVNNHMTGLSLAASHRPTIIIVIVPLQLPLPQSSPPLSSHDLEPLLDPAALPTHRQPVGAAAHQGSPVLRLWATNLSGWATRTGPLGLIAGSVSRAAATLGQGLGPKCWPGTVPAFLKFLFRF